VRTVGRMAFFSGGDGTGALRFSVLGVPVAIAPTFWLVTLLLSLGRLGALELLVEWVVVVLVSILVHEMGHALVARRFEQSVWVELHGMGGSAYYDGRTALTSGQRIQVALAGPLAGVALGAVVYAGAWLVPPESALLDSAVRDALWVNWGYGLLNLLPILPLDGGHVMQELVDGVTQQRNHPAAYVVSLVAAVGLLVVSLQVGFSGGLFLIGWLIFHNLQNATVTERA